MPPNSSPTFTPHTPTSLVQLLVYKPCSLFLILITPSYFVQEKFLLFNYSCSAPTPFCIASISSAPNPPISANQSCSADSSNSSDSSDSSNSPTRYNPSMPS